MNHSLFKLILFLVAGVVFMNLAELELNEVRGFGRKKPLLKAAFLAGALGIGGIPLFSGYVSKTLLHESIVEYITEAHELLGSAALGRGVEILFLFSGGLTVAYMLKLYVALFHNRHPHRQREFEERAYAGLVTRFTLIGSAVVIPIFGILPNFLMDGVADLAGSFFAVHPLAHHVAYFSLTNLKGAVISIAVGIVVYFFFIRKVIMVEEAPGCYRYENRWPRWMDLERYIYVPVLIRFLPAVFYRIFQAADKLVDSIIIPALPEILHRIFWCADRILDLGIIMLQETVFRPLELETEDEEEARILRHRRRRHMAEFHRWSTVTLSFGFLMCFAGIMVMIYWVVFVMG